MERTEHLSGRHSKARAVALITAGLLLALAPQARGDELDDLKQTIKKLEDRVKALEAERAAAKAAPAPAAPAPAAAAPAEAKAAAVPILPPTETAAFVPPATVKGNEGAVERVDNAVIDPKMKGYIRLPDTQTLLKIGGYSKVDFIYDTKPIGSYDYFVTSEIPTSGPNTTRGTQFTVQAKQTRLNIDLRRDTEAGPARLFMEGDWFGDASFGFEPGSYKAQLRHAFGEVENFASGYTFSAFMDNDALPDTVDFEGPGAAPFVLDAGARYFYKVNGSSNLAFSVEAPSAQVTAPAGGGKSTLPDLVLRYRYEVDAGHLQVSGVYRRLGWDSGAGEHEATNGYGVNLAGSHKAWGDDYVVAGWTWGEGIARYISDITGLGLDAALSPSGSLEALQAHGGYAAYTHYWTAKLRTTGVIDYLKMNDKSYQSPESFQESQYYSANLIWNPYGTLNVGMELLHGYYKTHDERNANDTRIQMSVQYDFVR